MITRQEARRPPIRLLAACAAWAFAAALAGPAEAAESGTLHVGDRLKITVYEVVEVADRPANDASAHDGDPPPVQTAFPRLDLTGEYAIEPSGRLTLPLIGGFEAADRPLEAFRADLDEAFAKTFRRRPNVAIAFVQRAPVYVVGAVRSPGSFTYVPGLFVLQAAALAGGDLGNAPPGQAMELVREQVQRDAARERLKALVLRRAVLAAESGGVPLASSDEALSRLVGAESAATLLGREQQLLKLRLQGRASARAIQARAASVAGEEVELLAQRITNYDVQVKIRGERLRMMEALFSRQVVESERVADVRRDFADMEGRRRDLEITALQTRQRFEAAQKALEQDDLERRLALENDLNRVTSEMREAERALAAASATAALLERTTVRPAGEGEVVTYGILRRQGGELKTLRASEGETLEPGDVLKVEIRKPAVPPAGDRLAAN